MCELMEKFGEIKCKEKILPVKRAVSNEIFTAWVSGRNKDAAACIHDGRYRCDGETTCR